MKILLKFIFSFFVMGFFVACGNNNSIDPPKFEGKWLVVERTVQTNYPDVDTIVNNMFKDDANVYRTLREFSKSDVVTTATKGETVQRRLTENYTVEADSLIVQDMVLGYPIKSQFLLSYTILTSSRAVNQKELVSLLAWIEMTDPNGITILPRDMVGVLRMKEVRVSE